MTLQQCRCLEADILFAIRSGVIRANDMEMERPNELDFVEQIDPVKDSLDGVESIRSFLENEETEVDFGVRAERGHRVS